MSDAVNPYATPQAVVADVPSGAPELASRTARLGAAFLDGFIAGVPLILVVVAYGILGHERRPFEHTSWALQFGLAALYFATYFALNWKLLAREGQTIGKRMVGVRIVRSDGSRATLSHLAWRRIIPYAVLGQIPVLNLIPGIDPLLIFRASRKCLHDVTADTIVVKA